MPLQTSRPARLMWEWSHMYPECLCPSTHIVKLAAHHVHVRRYCSQIIIGLFVAHIARADNLADLARDLPCELAPDMPKSAAHQQALELCRKVVCQGGNVKVTNDEDEDHFGDDIAPRERP